MIVSHTIHNPHHEPTGETFAVLVKTALGETRIPCWTLAEAQDIRDSVFDVGLTCRILGLPMTLAVVSFDDGDDGELLERRRRR
jgi:hypothetical protein